MFKLVLRVNSQHYRDRPSEHRQTPRSIMRCVRWPTVPGIGDTVHVFADYDMLVESRIHHIDDNRIDVCFSATLGEVLELFENKEGGWENVDAEEKTAFDNWTN